jgi:hypothetical protein
MLIAGKGLTETLAGGLSGDVLLELPRVATRTGFEAVAAFQLFTADRIGMRSDGTPASIENEPGRATEDGTLPSTPIKGVACAATAAGKTDPGTGTFAENGNAALISALIPTAGVSSAASEVPASTAARCNCSLKKPGAPSWLGGSEDGTPAAGIIPAPTTVEANTAKTNATAPPKMET